MQSFFLSLTVLALAWNYLQAASTSGLLRDRHEAGRRRHLGSKGYKGKAKSGGNTALFPSCSSHESSSISKSKGGSKGGSKSKSKAGFLDEMDGANRLLQKGKGGKGKSSSTKDDGCDCNPPTDLCHDKEREPIVCGATITQDTVLSTSLGCDLNSADEFAILVDGATLECNGDGENVIYGTGGSSGDHACVVLRNGSTLKNCYVYNCGIGVVMQGIGNNRIVGGFIYGHMIGVEAANPPLVGVRPNPDLGDDGCYSIECTKIIGIGDIGIFARNNGNMIISNTEVLGVQGIGIQIKPLVGNTLSVAIEDVNIFGTNTDAVRSDGILVGGSGSYGTLEELGFYGETKIVLSKIGLNEQMINTEATVPPIIIVYGSLESYDSFEESYQLATAAMVLQDESETLACTHGGASFDIANVGGFMNMGSDLTCLDVPGVPLECPDGVCPALPSIAFACSGNEISTASKGKSKGSSGSKGKGKGGARRV